MNRTYDPKQVVVIFGGRQVRGYADGTFVEVVRDEDMFSLYVGADGESTRAKSNNKSGSVTVTLQQSSPSNDELSELALADELGNAGVLPLLVKDGSGRALFTAEQAWIQKMADSAFGNETETREWVIRTGELIPFVGGN